MNIPMARSATQEQVAVEDSAIVRYATDSTSSTLEPEQCRTASDKLAYHRNLREALLKISHSPDDSIMVATQPLQSYRSLALSMPRFSFSHATTVTARCRGAARCLAGPSRASQQSRLWSSARAAKARLMLVRP